MKNGLNELRKILKEKLIVLKADPEKSVKILSFINDENFENVDFVCCFSTENSLKEELFYLQINREYLNKIKNVNETAWKKIDYYCNYDYLKKEKVITIPIAFDKSNNLIFYYYDKPLDIFNPNITPGNHIASYLWVDLVDIFKNINIESIKLEIFGNARSINDDEINKLFPVKGNQKKSISNSSIFETNKTSSSNNISKLQIDNEQTKQVGEFDIWQLYDEYLGLILPASPRKMVNRTKSSKNLAETNENFVDIKPNSFS